MEQRGWRSRWHHPAASAWFAVRRASVRRWSRFTLLHCLDMEAREAENVRVVRCVLLVTLLCVTACRGRGDGAPPCSAVAARFVDIARHELANAKLDESTGRAVTDQLPAMRDSLSQACTDGRWSAGVRQCLVQANDHAGFETCEQQLTDEQRGDLERATRGRPETP